MINSLKYLLKNIVDFDEQHLDKIVACFKPKTVKQNTILLYEGDVCKEFYFIHKGCIRTCFIDKNDYEKTRFVMLDCSIGTALTSFIFQEPSSEFIEVLDDSELLAISQEDFYRLNKEIDQWKVFYQKILEWAYSYQNKKIKGLVTLTASQRYQQIMRENPDLIQRLSNRVLASFIDIKPETLSRLKSR